ncbi:Protein C30F12.5 a, partial [Aphelenchoides avenae]
LNAEQSIYTDYEKCRDTEDFGKSSLVCDSDHQLKNSTDKIPCSCPNQCVRGDGRSDKYTGLFLTTNEAKVEAPGVALNETAKQIYDDAQLGNDQCDNGVLIIYNKDTGKLSTYRGSGRFTQLTDEDMAKLHALSLQDSGSEDPLSLALLLDQGAVHSRPEVQRAESWAPVIGLTVALVIIILILGILMALLLARLFRCCFRRKKKDKYHVTPVPTYKTIDPIYIVTNERPPFPPGPHSDVIYNTPYSGTPLPPATFAASGFIPPSHTPRPIVTHPSRSVTPTSTHRLKVHSTHGSVKSPDETPRADKKDRIHKTYTDTSKHSTATSTPETIPIGASAISPPPQRQSYMGPAAMTPPHGGPGHISSPAETGELSFLDPRRKLEVQTREEYIS